MGKIKPLNVTKPDRVNQYENKVRQVKAFLYKNYSIEINQFNPNQTRILSKHKKYKFPNRISIEDISLHLQEYDIPHSKTMLSDIIMSPNQVDVFDPIEEYFNSIRGTFTGVSHIDLLLSHLTPKDFGDKKRGYYVERMCKIIKKWFVASVACSLKKWPNDVMLVFVMEEEGEGKTTLAKYTCPEALCDMLKESSKNKKVFQFDEAFANNFIVLFDEMFGINSFSADNFKKTMSSTQIELKFRHNSIPVSIPRIGNAVGTTNNKTGNTKSGFLTRSLGYRRFGCVHLDKINWEYSDKVDINIIWAEALTLFEGGFNYMWDKNDFEEFKEYNTRYIIETEIHAIIRAYIEKPTNGEGLWLQPKDIIDELLKRKAISRENRMLITTEKIGEALSGMGFKRESKHIPDIGSRRTYHIKFL